MAKSRDICHDTTPLSSYTLTDLSHLQMMPKIMSQNGNDWANISALVQIEAMYQGMRTVYEQSIQAVNFKKGYHFI